MDPGIDRQFSAGKYPEFAKWRNTMAEADAADYVSNSAVRDTLYHATLEGRAKSIRESRVDVTRSAETVIFAAGHYAAKDAGYASRFGPELLKQKMLIKNPFTVGNEADFRAWQDLEQITSLPERVWARVSTATLLSRNHDGLRILKDTSGDENSEAWLAFHPRQVVFFD